MNSIYFLIALLLPGLIVCAKDFETCYWDAIKNPDLTKCNSEAVQKFPGNSMCMAMAQMKCFENAAGKLCGWSQDDFTKNSEKIYEFFKNAGGISGSRDENMKKCGLNGANRVTWNIELIIPILFALFKIFN